MSHTSHSLTNDKKTYTKIAYKMIASYRRRCKQPRGRRMLNKISTYNLLSQLKRSRKLLKVSHSSRMTPLTLQILTKAQWVIYLSLK